MAGGKDNTVTIDADSAGQRFDKFLIRLFPAGGKGFVYKMLRKKRVKLNGERAQGNEILNEGDAVTMYISPETRAELAGNKDIKPSGTVLNILYEDGDVLVVNKPANCLTHPDLVNAARGRSSGGFNPVAVNRLDRNTTGIVIIAKTLPAAQELSRAIRERLIEKTYLAAVSGVITKPAVLKGFAVKDRETNKTGFDARGKEAVTEIEPIFNNNEITVLKINLVTGRSHQIRAHLQSIGKPVIGDPKYGDAAVNRKYGAKSQLLHAWKVRFSGLTGRLEYLNGKEISCEPENAPDVIMNMNGD
ncbi:MAG: RluA family pseudouridine synthase [Defluviitaleaceae bacterium]|nr:RluA family pseudouridine synthase [Defluviitaleaceae bacterium]MCL2836345.1 RluA family pseudouridine synthase [Defluviitaleaceae bacterium]